MAVYIVVEVKGQASGRAAAHFKMLPVEGPAGMSR